MLKAETCNHGLPRLSWISVFPLQSPLSFSVSLQSLTYNPTEFSCLKEQSSLSFGPSYMLFPSASKTLLLTFAWQITEPFRTQLICFFFSEEILSLTFLVGSKVLVNTTLKHCIMFCIILYCDSLITITCLFYSALCSKLPLEKTKKTDL